MYFRLLYSFVCNLTAVEGILTCDVTMKQFEGSNNVRGIYIILFYLNLMFNNITYH